MTTNPYTSPGGEIDRSHSLTKLERRTLEFYRTFRHRRLSMLTIAPRYAPSWSFLVAITALVYFLGRISSDVPHNVAIAFAVLLGVFSAGAIIRDLGYARKLVKTWPLLTQVFDWDEVYRRLDQD